MALFPHFTARFARKRFTSYGFIIRVLGYYRRTCLGVGGRGGVVAYSANRIEAQGIAALRVRLMGEWRNRARCTKSLRT